MPVASVSHETREAVAVHRERQYNAYVNFQYAAEKEQGSREIIAANEVIDRQDIENKAWEYIRNFAPKPKELRANEADDNARTALFEALMQSGHMSQVRLEGDVNTVHEQVMERLLNGYFRQGLPEAERARVFQEICEELTFYEVSLQIMTGFMPPDTKMTTYSDYADSLGSLAPKFGYREENRKGMLRSSYLVFEQGKTFRVIDQISRSNSVALQTIAALERRGFSVPRSNYADVDLLGFQQLSRSQGALEVMRWIDKSGDDGVMYGEPISEKTVPYEELLNVSKERENRVEQFVKRLAHYEKTLDARRRRGEIHDAEWQKLYISEVRDIVRAICVVDPSYVRDVLGGGDVEEAYLRAHEQYMAGDHSGAAATIGTVASAENTITICGNQDVVVKEGKPQDPTKSPIAEMLEAAGPHSGEYVDRCMKCPLCKTLNVRVTIIKGEKYYTCVGEGGCGESTLPKGHGRKQGTAEEQKPEVPNKPKLWLEEYIKSFGDTAMLKTTILVGDARRDIVARDGTILKEGVTQADFTLAK